MIRTYIIAGLSLALCALVVAFFLQREALASTRAALARCEAYKETTNEVRDATSNLPTAVDDILERLRDLAGGQGDSNP